MIVAVAGCVAQAEGAEILRRAPMSISCSGRRPITACRSWWRARRAREGAVLDTDFRPRASSTSCRRRGARRRRRRFLSVQEGCDKFCTFCVVPYTRGAEFSRPAPAIAAEARRWSSSGAREITLLGQNVNAYHGDGADGGELGPRPARSARWPRSPGWRASATPPPIRATWTTS